MVTPARGQDFGSVEASCMMNMGQLHPGFAPQNRLRSNVDHLVIIFLSLVSRSANKARTMLTTSLPRVRY